MIKAVLIQIFSIQNQNLGNLLIKVIKSFPLDFAIALVTTSVIVFGFLVVVLRIPYGFDWTDESFVTFLNLHPNTTLQQPWGFQHLSSPLQVYGPLTIISFRILRLILGVIAGLLVGIATIKILSILKQKTNVLQKITIFSVVQLGTLVQWVFWPRYLSYNEWSFFFISIFFFSITFLLLHNSTDIKNKVLNNIVFGSLIGASLSGLFVAKFSSVLFPLIFLLAIFLYIKGREVIVILASIIFSSVVFISFLSLFTFRFVDYVKSIYLTITNPTATNDNARPPNFFEFYFSTLSTPLIFFSVITICTLSGFLIPLFYQGVLRVLSRFVIFSAFSFVLIVITALSLFRSSSMNADFAGSLFQVSRPGIVSLFWLVIGMASLFATYLFVENRANVKSFRTDKNFSLYFFDSRVVFLIILMILSPFAASFGTNNILINHATFGAWTWSALMVMGFLIISDLFKSQKKSLLVFSPISLVILSSLLSLQMVMYQIPYRTVAIPQANHLVESSGPLNGLFVSQTESYLISELHDFKSDLDESTVLVPLKSPGIALVLELDTLGSPWLDSSAPSAIKQLGLSNCPKNTKENLIVVFPLKYAQSEKKMLKAALEKNCGIRWPNDFKRIDRQFSPVEIYNSDYVFQAWQSREK